MASSSSSLCVALLVAVVLVNVLRVESATLQVGGDKGWTNKGVNYTDWAANNTVRVGDTVVFANKDSITHTIQLLGSLDDYTKCNFSSGTSIPIVAGSNYPFTVPANLENKTLYVACSVPGHCLAGQKLAGTVLPASSAAPSPLSPSTPAPNSPTTGSMGPGTGPSTSDGDLNRYICWTTAVILVGACFLASN